MAQLFSLVVLLGLGACGGSVATVAPPTIEDDTTLGAGDVFDVRVYGEEALTGEYRVARNGTIDFPFIGRTEVAGLDPPDVADLLARQLRDGGYLRDPQVSILVREYNSKRISVIGAVSRPGTFPLTPGMTVVQAVSAAGGFTALAAQNDLVVTRHREGERHRYNVRAGEVSAGEAPDMALQPGDIIFVPERIF